MALYKAVHSRIVGIIILGDSLAIKCILGLFLSVRAVYEVSSNYRLHYTATSIAIWSSGTMHSGQGGSCWRALLQSGEACYLLVPEGYE